jgi:C1A family cysteine protease
MPQLRQIGGFGWKPDVADHRDLRFSPPAETLASLPQSVDLINQCPAIYDQGWLNSCTPNIIAAAIEFDRKKQNLPEFTPSRLFIYYNIRVVQNEVNDDKGAEIRAGIKSVASQGVCPEADWPYDGNPLPSNQRLTIKPPQSCYDTALNHRAISYHRVLRDVDQMKACLAMGYPFTFGFGLYVSFDNSYSTGDIPLPAQGEAKMPDGDGNPALHAMLVVGYDDARQVMLVRNSWGPRWATDRPDGLIGYGTIPYDYFRNDFPTKCFWTIRLVQ